MDYSDIDRKLEEAAPMPAFPKQRIKDLLKQFNMHKASKGFQIAVLLILVSVIPMTLYLSQQNQDTRQHAEQDNDQIGGNSNDNNTDKTPSGNSPADNQNAGSQNNTSGDINGRLGDQNPGGNSGTNYTEQTMLDQANAKNNELANGNHASGNDLSAVATAQKNDNEAYQNYENAVHEYGSGSQQADDAYKAAQAADATVRNLAAQQTSQNFADFNSNPQVNSDTFTSPNGSIKVPKDATQTGDTVYIRRLGTD